MNPPSWVLISGLLKMMDKKFSMKPSLGDLPLQHARCFQPLKLHRQCEAYRIKEKHMHNVWACQSCCGLYQSNIGACRSCVVLLLQQVQVRGIACIAAWQAMTDYQNDVLQLCTIHC